MPAVRTSTWLRAMIRFLLIAVGMCAETVRAGEVTVNIDCRAQHQTILGWSAMPWYLGINPEVRDQALDEAVEQLGLTWLHWTVPSGNRSNMRAWEPVPTEFAEYAASLLVHLKKKHGIEADNSDRGKTRGFAVAKGLPTGHAGSDRSDFDVLYDDLTIGGVSYWSIGSLGGPGPGGKNYHFHLSGTSFGRGEQFWQCRQIMHYVRPGSMHIEANCDLPALRPLAFSADGRTTAMLINARPSSRPHSVTIRGLRPGNYCACQSGGKQQRLQAGGRRRDDQGVGPTHGETRIADEGPVFRWCEHPYHMELHSGRQRRSGGMEARRRSQLPLVRRPEPAVDGQDPPVCRRKRPGHGVVGVHAPEDWPSIR